MTTNRWGMALATATAALALASCISRHTPESARHPAQITYAEGEYTGSAVCAECHYPIAHAYSSTRHANSLHLLNDPAARTTAPPNGTIDKTEFMIRSTKGGGGYHVAYTGLAAVQMDNGFAGDSPLDMAIGSGKGGVSYVTVLRSDQLMIMRYSYFPHLKKWFRTPRPKILGATDLGEVIHDATARDCVTCHSTYLAPDTLLPDRKYAGVGCESCHGPGGAHVNAARGGKFHDLKIEHLATAPADAVTHDLCGHCHSLESNIRTASVGGAFPIASFRGHRADLAKSRCYLRSQGKLSCLSCHDPHTDVSHDEAKYNAVCMNCHTAQAAAPAPQSGHTPGVCLLKGAGHNCISCHMPKHPLVTAREVHTAVPVTITSHYIAVYGR